MKHIDISEECYAHLMESNVYIYINNEFSKMLYVDNIEFMKDPISLIKDEIELLSRDSLHECSFSF